ncbi:MAG: FAD:protein FMN transferase [Dehalococcoidia bacterium]|nr:FAD:protein FMN transferase [Dehalococcoidia bacterium]
MRETSRIFNAMNTEVMVAVASDGADTCAVEAALCEVERLFAHVEAEASRFRPESELSRLNASSGQPFRASPVLFNLVFMAKAAAQSTDGIFDPTILGALVTAGYDRSFDLLDQESVSPAASTGSARAHSWRDVGLDAQTRTIHLPPGCGLDLGGIGKGWCVDQAAAGFQRFGNFAVDAGGDIFAGGFQFDGSDWTVGVEDPFMPGDDLAVIKVRDRAVATSTTACRSWTRCGRKSHHLIDPRTGAPSQSGVVSATVVAESVANAEVLAKTALLLGPEMGLRFLEERPDVSGLLVLSDGEMLCSRSFNEAEYLA